MRWSVMLVAAFASSVQAAPSPVEQPTKLEPAWQARTRALLEKSIEIPTVINRGQVPKLAQLYADELKGAGFASADVRIIPYEGLPGDKTAALIARWRAPNATRKPILVLGHMDVVEARREDWTFDPFEFREQDGYFLGRGTADMKNGIVAAIVAMQKLKQSGFTPDRDIILFLTGDEETAMNGARLGASDWKQHLDAEFGLNADGGCAAYDKSGRPLGCGISTAEKTYQTYFFTTTNPGGHSSRPRRDNAIYDLADALKRLQAHRFEPMLNETTRAYFAERAKQEASTSLGQAMRRWLANPDDGAAADVIENNELEVGRTRTRCVATMLSGGHADNALPQSAKGTVNCRIMPGVDTKAVLSELQRVAGDKVKVTFDESFLGKTTPPSPLREDVFAAVQRAIARVHGSNMKITPIMSTGASDGSWFRAAGIPVYDVDGSWGISPDDERAHGLDERIPVRAMYDDVLHWESILRDLAGRR
jgi:acetylornithine deacetylase/succinyl-diaminopimelate desuccinylase-like protein